MRQFISREPLTALLAEAREPFKDRLDAAGDGEERTLIAARGGNGGHDAAG